MAHLIDKDVLVGEIERRISGWTDRLNNTNPSNPSYFEGGIEVGKHILSFLNTLEVKEVDLDEEIKRFTMSKELYETKSVIRTVAKHFFELGLKKGQKGE